MCEMISNVVERLTKEFVMCNISSRCAPHFIFLFTKLFSRNSEIHCTLIGKFILFVKENLEQWSLHDVTVEARTLS